MNILRGVISTIEKRSYLARAPALVAFLAMLSVALSGTAAAADTGARSGGTGTACDPLTGFARSNFTSPLRINNRFLPLVPGTQWTLEGRASTTGAPLPHKVIFTVTDLVKVIDGVRTRVIWDRDIQDGQLAEAELAFFAQDKQGNVWSMGEYPEEYDEEGNLEGAPATWIPGVDGAQAGVMMPAQQIPGAPPYLQGSSPKIEFLDCGQTFQTGQSVCVPVKCYNDVLVTDETSPLASDVAHQRKFYAPGKGNVQISAVDDPEGETLVLTRLIKLGPKWVVNARKQALKLDRRGLRSNPVYKKTKPAYRG